ncbi:MAG: cation:proton antiporter [Kiritimatiellae bacterium]|nr:cation:proton antiporter [Kiritimatiellia bacterium]
MSEGAFFRDLALLMSVAGLSAALFSRLGWPKVIGYILAGALMSEHTLGVSLFRDPQSISTVGQLGVVFLMFSMGLSFSAKEMKKIRAVALPAAVLDTVVMIWLGYTVGTRVFGWSAVESAFLGVAMCDSATTLLAKVIDEMGWGNRPFAKYVLGTSLCEDIICVGAIAVVTGFATGGGMSASAFAGSLGWLAVFFLAVLVFGMVLVPRLLLSVSSRKDDEALALTLLGVCFLVSFLAYHFNFSLALGAFLVGIIGSTSDVRERLAALVDPLKSMFAATFFVSIGLLVDPSALWASKTAILVVSLVVVVGKLFNITFASLLAGVDVRTSVQNGFALAQIGEFAFMVAILYAGIVNDTSIPMFQIAIGASLLTTLMNPWMIRLSGPAGDLAERLVPERFRVFLDAYRAWLAKIGASEGSPAFRRLKFAAIRLGVYAVLMFAVASACTLLYRIDYAGLSEFFERHDQIFFFCLANLFCVAMLPLWTGSARPLADSVTELLCGEGTARWQSAIQPLVRFVAFAAVFVLFLAEWGAIAVSIAPAKGPSLWIGIAVIVLVGAFGWRRMVKAGHRASKRLHEALTAEERREGLKRTMTVTIPEGTISEVVIPATSPAIGGTVVTLNVRAKTGASVVSVVRGGKTTRNIGPEWEFRAGDRIVALGDHKQIAALKDLMGVTS